MHVGDRENDIYEFFCAACELGTHFLVRTCVDRLALDGQCTVATVMTAAPLAGTHGVEVTADDGTAHTVELELRFVRVRVLPPIGKQKRYPALDLTILHARETAELEAVLHGHPAVVDCAVFGIPDARAGEVPVASVRLDPDHPVDTGELEQLVASSLATYQHLRHLVVVDAIPRLPSGKVLRRTLRDEWVPRLTPEEAPA